MLVGVVGGLCYLAVHNGCFHPPAPVVLPDPGTPRASYCSAVVPEKPWILMLLAPCVLVILTGLVVRRKRVTLRVAVVLCAVLVANAIAANALTSARTI